MTSMTSPTLDGQREFIDLIAGEVIIGVHTAVRHWMGEIEQILASDSSDADKLQRIRAIVEHAGCNSLNRHGPIL